MVCASERPVGGIGTMIRRGSMTTLRPVAPALEMEWDRWALSTACASRACSQRAAATMRRSKSLMGHQVTRPVAIERARALMKRGPPYLGQRVYRQQLRQPRLYHRPLIRVKHRRNILCRPLTHLDTFRHTQAPRLARLAQLDEAIPPGRRCLGKAVALEQFPRGPLDDVAGATVDQVVQEPLKGSRASIRLCRCASSAS